MNNSEAINQEETPKPNRWGPDIYLPNWREQEQRTQVIAQHLFSIVTDEELQRLLQMSNRALTIYRGNFQAGWSRNVEDIVQILPGNRIRFGSWDEISVSISGVLSLQVPENPDFYPEEPRAEDGRILLEDGDKPQGKMTTPEDSMDSVEKKYQWGSAWSESAEINAETRNKQYKRPLTEMVRTGPFLISVRPAEERIQAIDRAVQEYLHGQS